MERDLLILGSPFKKHLFPHSNIINDMFTKWDAKVESDYENQETVLETVLWVGSLQLQFSLFSVI